jgi:hypothetical protein
MARLSCDTTEEIVHLVENHFLSTAATKFGSTLLAVPKVSKNLVAYLAGLVAVSPYKHGPFDSRAKGVAVRDTCGACIRRGV